MPWPFVNPGWLAGAASGAAPIIIHLLNKQRYRRMLWAAMEFLRRAVEKRRRRLRIEHLILLAVRTLILVLLALALARPVLGTSPLDLVAQSSTLRVFVVDTSFSMDYDVGGESALERAKKFAVAAADRMSGQDASSVILANDAAIPAIEQPMSDRERVKETLAGIERTDRGTDSVKALQAACAIVNQNVMPNNVLYVLGDFQELGWRLTEGERLATLKKALDSLQRRTRVIFVDAGVAEPRNVAVTGLHVADPVVATLVPTEIAVDVANYSDAVVSDVPVDLIIDDRNVASDVLPEIKPASLARKTFPVTFDRPGFHALRAQTRADALRPDDQRHLALRVRESVRVLIVDGDPGGLPEEAESFYLRLAMRPEAHSYLERRFVLDPKVVNEVVFEQEALADYDLVVLANVAQLAPDRVRALAGYVRRGGALMLFMGEFTVPEDYNLMLGKKGPGLLPVMLEAVTGNPVYQDVFVRLRIASPNHPVMRTILESGGRFSLTQGRIWRYLTGTVDEADPGVEVLARFDDPVATSGPSPAAGTPAIVEQQFGLGRVCYVGTSASGDWHNLVSLRALPLYPLFVHEMSQSLVQASPAGRNLEIGEPYLRTVSPQELQGAILLTSPQGQIEDLEPEGEPGSEHVRWAATERAGAYTLELRGTNAAAGFSSRPSSDGFVVNLPAAESNVARIDEKRLEELLPKTEHVTYEFRRADEGGAQAGAPPQSEIWKTLLLILGGLICLESFLAWKFGRYR